MKRLLSYCHPFLFAIYPVLFLYSENIREMFLVEILLPLIIVLCFSFIAQLLISRILMDSAKSGIIISSFFIFFFSYGHVFSFVKELCDKQHKFLFLICILLICLISFFVMKSSRSLHNFTKAFNAISLTLVTMSLINISIHFHISHNLRMYDAYKEDHKIAIDETCVIDPLPDIYYIILDRYGNTASLKELYGYDNSEFIQFLRNKGFYVASQSRANYPNTALSLASSLNMKYINFFSESIGPNSSNLKPAYKLIKENRIQQFFRSNGYQYIHFGSYWEPTRESKYADKTYNYAYPEFLKLLYRTTMLYPIGAKLGIRGFVSDRKEHWRRVRNKFEMFAQIPEIEEPTFIFAHMIIPHHPYVFHKDGRFVSGKEIGTMSLQERYISQLIYVNKKLIELIEIILSESKIPPIIIIQGDEGPCPQRYNDQKGSFDWTQATDSEIKIKMSIINAFYFPNISKEARDKFLQQRCTPVNTFRIILNLYFGANLELLPDKSYTFEDWHHVYSFIDVTDKL